MDKSVNELLIYVFGNYYEQMLHTKHTDKATHTQIKCLLPQILWLLLWCISSYIKDNGEYAKDMEKYQSRQAMLL